MQTLSSSDAASSPAEPWLWLATLTIAGVAFATLVARPPHLQSTAAWPEPHDVHGGVQIPCAGAEMAPTASPMHAMLERRMRRHDVRRFTA